MARDYNSEGVANKEPKPKKDPHLGSLANEQDNDEQELRDLNKKAGANQIPPPVSRSYKDSALIRARELGAGAGVVGGGAAYYWCTAELAARYAANAATAVGVRWLFWQAARVLVTSAPVAIAGGGLYAGCRIYNAYGAPAIERENEKLAKRNEYLESLLPKNLKSQ